MPTQHVIPADHPALPGHFPGHPIVPGVVILDRIVAELAAQTGLEARGVKRMKFTRPLAPGEAFTVAFSPPQSKGVRFTVSVGEEALASGQLLLA
jgi:3-hydroxymyristoyl/3-hydroxydecanoyl-(acyl carrier protein) dehydratases